MAISIDKSKFPIVTMTYIDTVTDEDIKEMRTALLRLVEGRATFYLISDMTNGAPSVKQADKIKEFMNENRQAFRSYLALNSVVVGNAFLRATLRTALLGFRPPFPVQVEPTMNDARACITAMMAQAALPKAGSR